MGMVVEFVRLTPEELNRALADPDWAEGFTNDLLDVEEDYREELSVEQRRGYDVGKDWDALRILVHRAADLELCPFLGGAPFGQVWSYDEPRAFTVEQVRTLAERLGSVSFDRLVEVYDEASLAEAYCAPWPREEVARLREDYDGLVHYFQAAAAEGHGMIVYIG